MAGEAISVVGRIHSSWREKARPTLLQLARGASRKLGIVVPVDAASRLIVVRGNVTRLVACQLILKESLR